jgi:hypothetical protein
MKKKQQSDFCLFFSESRESLSLLHYYSLVGLIHHKRARAIKRERERESRKERGSSERGESRSPARE